MDCKKDRREEEKTIRILFISNYGRETFASGQFNFIKNFEKYGHQIDHLYPRDGPVLDQIKSKKITPPDIVIYCEGLLFQPTNWLKLPFKIPKLWWFMDSPILFHQQIEWFKETDSDLAFVRDWRDVKRFESEGIKTRYFGTIIDSDNWNIYPNIERNIDIGFVGFVGPTRTRWLNNFMLITDSVEAWGDAEVKDNRFVNHRNPDKWIHKECAIAYNRTRIAPHRTGRYEGTRTKGEGFQGDNTARPYEASACGAMMLTEHFDGIEHLFDIGKELIMYDMNDEAEMLELATYYLDRSEEREKISAAGYSRTMRDHTWKNSVEKVESWVKELI